MKYNLLKEWNDCQEQTKRILKDFKFVIPILKIEHGYNKHISKYASIELLEEVFGFPYTSSSGFGAIWNTNTQAKINNMYFRGLATDENNDTIIILETEDGKNKFYNITKEIHFDWLVIPNKRIYDCFIMVHELNFDVYLSEWSDIDHTTYGTYGKNGIFAYFGQSAGYDWMLETATKHKPNANTGGGWQVFETSGELTKEKLNKTYLSSYDKINKQQEKQVDLKEFYSTHKKIIF